MRLIIYSNNDHDKIFIGILNILLKAYNFDSLIIFSSKKKFKRLSIELKNLFLVKKHVEFVKFVSLFNLEFSNFNYILRRIIKLPFRIFNGLKIYYYFKKYANNRTLFYLFEQFSIVEDYFLYRGIKNTIIRDSFFVMHDVENYYFEDFAKKSILSFKLQELFSNIIVFSEHLKKSLESKTKRRIIVFNGFEKNSLFIDQRKSILDTLNDEICFIVTGRVDKKAKDYIAIFDLFLNLKVNYKLILLGPVFDKELIKTALNRNIVIEYFENYVSQKEFDKFILKGHFLVAFYSREIEYNSKVSGSLIDSFMYSIPLITNNLTFYSKYVNTIFIQNTNEFNSLFDREDISVLIYKEIKKSINLTQGYDVNDLVEDLRENVDNCNPK